MGTSYIAPVKRENEKKLSLVKIASYKTFLIVGTLPPSNPLSRVFDLGFDESLANDEL